MRVIHSTDTGFVSDMAKHELGDMRSDAELAHAAADSSPNVVQRPSLEAMAGFG